MEYINYVNMRVNAHASVIKFQIVVNLRHEHGKVPL